MNIPQQKAERIQRLRSRIRKYFIWSNALGFIVIPILCIALPLSFTIMGSQNLKLTLIFTILSTITVTVVVLIFIHQEGLLKQPLALDFDKDELRFFMLGSGWQSWSVRDLLSVTAQVEKTPLHGSYKGINIYESKIQTQIVLNFPDNRTLTISERRCWQFGSGPESIQHHLKLIYPLL